MSKKLISFIDNRFYKQFSDRWDDKLLRTEILERLKSHYIILDVGAGRGRIKEMNFKGIVKKVIGVDPDPRVIENTMLDEGIVGLGDNMPFFNNNMFDIVFCDNVLEHVVNPLKFYNEVSRVIKPGGLFISKTPNKYYYVSVIASLTPEWFHKYVNKKRGRNESDTFGTYYKANTLKTQVELARVNSFKVIKATYVEGRPEYLRIFFITYLIGLFFERAVNFLHLDSLKAIIITVHQKE